MKVLNPTTNFLDLFMAACAAVVVHVVVLGFGGAIILDKPPTPQIQIQDRLQSVSMVIEKQPERELVKKHQRVERKKEPIRKEQSDHRRSRVERDWQQPVAADRALKEHRTERTVKEKPVREKVLVERIESLTEEPPEGNPSNEGIQPVIIARNPVHLCKKGWEPKYPEEARKKGIGGYVRVLFTISPKGRVLDAKVFLSSGYAILDDSMVEQLKAQKFSPAISKAGVPVQWRGIWGWNFRPVTEGSPFGTF